MSPITAQSLLLATIALAMIIRMPYALARRRIKITANHQDMQEKALLIIVTTGLMLLPILSFTSPWLHFADYQATAAQAWVGAALLIPFLFLFWRSHDDLGKNWSVTLELCEDQSLITQGIYRHMRHPMYAAMWLWAIAQALLVPNWLAGFSGIFCFGLMYLLRVPREEAMMLKQFGDEYRHYMNSTPRVFFKL